MKTAPSSKAIFLDIDGVLNFHKPESKDQTRTIRPELLSRLKRIVGRTGARVILASTWRHDEIALAEARARGVPIDDILPDLRPKSRGIEVSAWVKAHPEVTRYVILDDEDDYGLKGLFQPQAGQGLRDHLVDEIIAYLNGESNHCGHRNWMIRAAQRVYLALTGHRG